jgi:hypothetical protein
MSETAAARPSETALLQAALSKAQADFPPIERSRKVKVKTRTGGAYEFSYAPLNAILAATRPILAKHGLALSQGLRAFGESIVLRTTLTHSGGGALSDEWPLPFREGMSPQEIGSLLTYARRYALSAMLGIASEEDDDANAAAGQEVMERERAPSPKGPKPTKAQVEEALQLGDRLVELKLGSWKQIGAGMQSEYGTDVLEDLSRSQILNLIERLRKRLHEDFDAKVY